MIWVLFVVLSGFADAVMFAVMKKLKNANDSVLVWIQYGFALPFLLLLLYFAYPKHIIYSVYWVAFINGIILLVSTYLMVKAIHNGDLSSSMPMLSFTPLFLVVNSYLFLGELPTLHGFIGIVLIVLGAFIINVKDFRNGFTAPFRSLVINKGSLYCIIVAFMWSITANLFKIGILGSNPVYYSMLVYFVISVMMIPILGFKFRDSIRDIKSNFALLSILGIASAVMVVLSSYSMLNAIVPYVIAIKRSSVVFSIFFGYYMFKEKNIKPALIGAIIILAGGILITLF